MERNLVRNKETGEVWEVTITDERSGASLENIHTSQENEITFEALAHDDTTHIEYPKTYFDLFGF